MDQHSLVGLLSRADNVDATVSVDIAHHRVLDPWRVADRDVRPEFLHRPVSSGIQVDLRDAAFLPADGEVEVSVPVDVEELSAVGASQARVDRMPCPGENAC